MPLENADMHAPLTVGDEVRDCMRVCVRRGGGGVFLVLFCIAFVLLQSVGDGYVRFEDGELTVSPRGLCVVILGSCS